MQIQQVTTEEEYQKIDDFFSKMWKELFEIDCKNQIDKYKFCDIYYFEENSQIISAIIYNYKKWEKKIHSIYHYEGSYDNPFYKSILKRFFKEKCYKLFS